MDRTEQLRRAGAADLTSHVEGSARELLSSHLGADPWERIETMREAGDRKAEAEGLAYQMEKERKALLARLASEYQGRAKGDLSEARAERLARADDRYQDHIEGTAAAMEKKERAQSEYWAIRSELEWDRAAVAHLNAMSKLEEPA